jgi:hypothetical protein
MTRYTKTGTPNTIGQINAELDLIALAIDDTFSRVGDVPNQLETSLDMNSNHIINLPIPSLFSDPVRLVDISYWGALQGETVTPYYFTATAGQTEYVFPVDVLQVRKVFVEGIFQTPATSWTYSVSTKTLTFTSPLTSGEQISIFTGTQSPVTADASSQIVTSSDGTKTSSLAGWTQDIVNLPTPLTMAELKVLASAKVGFGYEVSDRGAVFNIVLTSSVTPNTFNIVQLTSNPLLSAVLEIRDEFSLESFGVISNDAGAVAGNTLALEAVVNYLRGSANHVVITMKGQVHANYFELSSLTNTSIRNVVFRASGGSQGVQDDIGAAFVFAGTTGLPEYLTGMQTQMLVSAGYNVEFDGVGITSSAAPAGANDRQLVIAAGDSPKFSSHMVRFKNAAISANAGVTFQTVPMLVFATKFFKTDNLLIGYPGNAAGLQIGIDDAGAPSVLLKGAVENMECKATFFTCDLVLNNVRAVNIDETCQFDELKSGGGAGRVLTSGDEKAAGVDIRATFLFVDNRGPAIVQASRAASAELLGTSGWRIKSIIRDRLEGIAITKGYINTDGCVFQSRTNNTGTVKGITIANGAQQVCIGPTTDFSVLQNNNHIAVEDNRTNPTGGLVLDLELAANITLGNITGYDTVMTGDTSRKLRGGSYKIRYSVSIKANVASRYKAKVVIDGVDVDLFIAKTALLNEDFYLSAERQIQLPSDTTSVSTVTVQIQQEDAGTAATIRGGTSIGSSYVQMEEVG